MDLSLLKETLSDYATFGGNIGTAFQSIPTLLTDILDFVNNFGKYADNTETGFKALSSDN